MSRSRGMGPLCCSCSIFRRVSIPWLLIFGQRGQTLGKQIQVIQVDIISDYAAAQAPIANTGQFVFTESTVRDPCFLECVVEF